MRTRRIGQLSEHLLSLIAEADEPQTVVELMAAGGITDKLATCQQVLARLEKRGLISRAGRQAGTGRRGRYLRWTLPEDDGDLYTLLNVE